MSEKVKAQIRAIKEGLMAIATKLEELDKCYGELPAEVKAEIESIPRIDLADLEELPWMKWEKDEQGNRVPAGPGEAGWIKNPAYFTSLEAPPVQLELVKALTKAGGKLELGEYKFTFSGSDKQFMARRPIKPKT